MALALRDHAVFKEPFSKYCHILHVRDLDVRMNLRGADIGHHISDPGVGKYFGK